MTSLISWPMRLDPSGVVATRDDGSEDYMAEELAQLVQTSPGERPLVPTYGVNDPTFGQFSSADLVAAVVTFGPPVLITEARTRWVSDREQDVVITFVRSQTSRDRTPVGTLVTDQEVFYADA